VSFDVLTIKSNEKSILLTTFVFEVSKSKLSDTKTVGDGRVVGYFRLILTQPLSFTQPFFPNL